MKKNMIGGVCVCGCSLGEPVRHQEYFQTFFIYSNTK